MSDLDLDDPFQDEDLGLDAPSAPPAGLAGPADGLDVDAPFAEEVAAAPAEAKQEDAELDLDLGLDDVGKGPATGVAAGAGAGAGMGAGAGGSVAGAFSCSSTGATGSLNITVCDPKKQGEGMHSFISYMIKTITDMPQFDAPNFTVVRRFSDFVWLHQHLSKDFPGLLIPPVPEKLVMGRFGPEFVESRRRALEKFVNRVGAHPELRVSDKFKTFLESASDGLAVMKEAVKAQEGGAKSRFMGWASTAYNTVAAKVGKPVEIPRSPDDVAFDELSAYINALHPQVTNVHKHTDNLVRRGMEMGDALHEFGFAFSFLGESEAEAEGGLGRALTQMGHTADQLSVITKESAEREMLHFEEPMKVRGCGGSEKPAPACWCSPIRM